MKKIIILILLCSLIGCSNRRKHVEISKESTTEIEKISLDSVKAETSKIDTKKITDKNIDQKKNEVSGDIIIRGKTDSITDFKFHNVVNGDTLQVINITGNSTFEIKNKYSKSEEKTVEKSSEENLNIIQKAARTAVAKSTIKKVATEVKQVDKNVKSKGFQFPVYLIIGASVLMLIVLFFLWKKFGGNIMDRLNKKR